MKIQLSTLLAVILCANGIARADEAQSRLSVHTGVHWGLGRMYNSLFTIPQRTMNTLDLQAMPAYQVLPSIPVSLGLFMEARRTGQNTEPSDVGNQNLGSTWILNYVLGVGAISHLGPCKAGAVFDFIGRHKLDKVDSQNRESKYKRPRGFHVLGGYKLWAEFYVDLSLSYLAYQCNDLAETENELTDNALKHWNAGIGISRTF